MHPDNNEQSSQQKKTKEAQLTTGTLHTHYTHTLQIMFPMAHVHFQAAPCTALIMNDKSIQINVSSLNVIIPYFVSWVRYVFIFIVYILHYYVHVF